MKARQASLDEPPHEYATKDEEEAEKDHLAPSRWWFQSTFFPLVGATFGPVANAFSICALSTDWRVIITAANADEAEGIDVQDPSWVYAINAVSLLLAVIANLALILHMAGRVRFSTSQPIVVAGWYISSFLLLGAVAAAPSHLPLPDGETRTFSQAYYYACFAAALYFILASMISSTIYGVHVRQYSPEYKLTLAQRLLIFQTAAFLVYLLAAAAVYMRIEGWRFLDAVYWCTVTLFTIGFGDYAPKTHLGRGLFLPMAVGGILFVGIIVASIKALVLEAGSKKVSRRNLEKARRSVMKSFDSKTGNVRANLFQTRNVGEDISTELQRREQEFNLMRKAQSRAKLTNALIALSISAGCWLFLWFIGAVIFWQAELGQGNWTYFESLYFTYVSFLTIGYGDFEPNTNSAKPAFVFWALLALPTLTVLIGAIGDSISEGINSLTLLIGEKLPAKTQALAELKDSANKAKGASTDGGAFNEAKPPGFMSDSGKDPEAHMDEGEAKAVKALSPGETKDNMQDRKDHEREKSTSATAVRHYRPLLLMREIENVVNHVNATPPRKYSYAEWTWFLGLLGEDESDSKQHRSLEAVKSAAREGLDNHDDRDVREPGLQEETKGQVEAWSWLGERSPLISTDDEPTWVLLRLMEALRRELKALGDEQWTGSAHYANRDRNELR